MTRKLIFFGITAIALVFSVSATMAQSPYGTQQPAVQPTSKGLDAMQRAATVNKYLFIFFWKEKSQQTTTMWGEFQTATSKLTNKADVVSINVSDPAEKPMVAKFSIDRSPMPLVLAIAPNGAITKGFTRFYENDLGQAFVSPCTAECLKLLQQRKLVLLCVEHLAPQVSQVTLPKGVQDFTADQQYAQTSKVVVLNANDPAETPFLKSLQLDPQAITPVTVLMSPPGSVVGTFDSDVTKEQLIAKLNSAQSSCCPGGKCGPKK